MKSLQGEEFDKWMQANQGNNIDDLLRDEYLIRLEKTSLKEGKYTSFKNQYNSANGQELKIKFWSKISSSRMAFDLYSWISTNSNCIEFQFEKKLSGIKSGKTMVCSDMDVFVRTSDNNIWFIESKFTEQIKNENLPEAYYQTRDEQGNIIEADYNVDTWYMNKENSKLLNSSLEKRFSGFADVAKLYVPFVKEMMEKAKDSHNKWFDTKQECCHLLGIIMFLLKDSSAKNSKIHFLNIVYGKEDNFIQKEHFATMFMEEATKMVENIISHNKLENITFDYKALTIQDVLEEYGDRKALGYDNKTVEQSIREHFEGLIQ